MAAEEIPERVAAAREELKQLEAVETEPPVYDERGNVRPRGTKGARPMTLAERKGIARGIKAKATRKRTTRKGKANG